MARFLLPFSTFSVCIEVSKSEHEFKHKNPYTHDSERESVLTGMN